MAWKRRKLGQGVALPQRWGICVQHLASEKTASFAFLSVFPNKWCD